MNKNGKTPFVLLALTLAMLGLAAAFHFNLWARPPKLPEIPLVDTNFLSTATARVSAAELFATPGADTSDFDCYTCHEKGKAPTIRYDKNGQIIVPTEHKDIVLGHGSHGRNNNCFNCHNETNLVTLQTRDGRELKITDSPSLCGSCHGPTFRDWEAGVHGRTGGYWDTKLGEMTYKPCTACHDPHHPKFPGRKPAPGPHPLHPDKTFEHQTSKESAKIQTPGQESSNIQAPSSRELSSSKNPKAIIGAQMQTLDLVRGVASEIPIQGLKGLDLGIWNFSGAWSLELGA